VRVPRAVSELNGVTGMAIVRAIAAGERDAQKLAPFRDRRCRQSEQEIAEPWSGHWREDHWFSWRQSLQMYDAIAERITADEQEILRKLADMEGEEHGGAPVPPVKNLQKAKAIKKRGQEPMRQALYRVR